MPFGPWWARSRVSEEEEKKKKDREVKFPGNGPWRHLPPWERPGSVGIGCRGRCFWVFR